MLHFRHAVFSLSGSCWFLFIFEQKNEACRFIFHLELTTDKKAGKSWWWAAGSENGSVDILSLNVILMLAEGREV